MNTMIVLLEINLTKTVLNRNKILRGSFKSQNTLLACSAGQTESEQFKKISVRNVGEIRIIQKKINVRSFFHMITCHTL